jgi:hypothetical protein
MDALVVDTEVINVGVVVIGKTAGRPFHLRGVLGCCKINCTEFQAKRAFEATKKNADEIYFHKLAKG